jgi:hypothetical protein
VIDSMPSTSTVQIKSKIAGRRRWAVWRHCTLHMNLHRAFVVGSHHTQRLFRAQLIVFGTSPGIASPFARIRVECDPDSNVLEYSAAEEGCGWQRGIRAAYNSAWIQRRQCAVGSQFASLSSRRSNPSRPPPPGPSCRRTFGYYTAKAAKDKLAVNTISSRGENRGHGGHGNHPGPSSLCTVGHFTGTESMHELAIHMISSPAEN